jgi:WhiB family transcriptional regulator, redox-sensing transcriptional regulator
VGQSAPVDRPAVSPHEAMTHETVHHEPASHRGWRSISACRDLPTGVFVSADAMGPREERAAKAVCSGCLVIDDCLAYAITHDVPFGVWGGLTMVERRPLRRSWLNSLAS